MSQKFHSRFEHGGNVPDDYRETSLCRAARKLNQGHELPVSFSDESLDYLWQLAYSLPRRGYLFIQNSREFVWQIAYDTLNTNDAENVAELKDVKLRKENAVANGDFETAVKFRDRQLELEAIVNSMAEHVVTPAMIDAALLADGVNAGG